VPEQWFERDPLWFKRAVFYEIHIRGFFDGNGDGSGDFRGLIEKLDYLEWLATPASRTPTGRSSTCSR
jgi:maltose alpha-D-glucosyltransferase/alpha-amylase